MLSVVHFIYFLTILQTLSKILYPSSRDGCFRNIYLVFSQLSILGKHIFSCRVVFGNTFVFDEVVSGQVGNTFVFDKTVPLKFCSFVNILVIDNVFSKI